MRKAGCQGLSIGNESGGPTMLRNLHKNFTVEQVTDPVYFAENWTSNTPVSCCWEDPEKIGKL